STRSLNFRSESSRLRSAGSDDLGSMGRHRNQRTLSFTSVILPSCDSIWTDGRRRRSARPRRGNYNRPNSVAKSLLMETLLAAVDLGSNSFRLSIGRVVQLDGAAQIYAIDRLKEHVRIAAGLEADNMLDEDSVQRATTSLKRFGELLAGFHP